MEFGRWLALKLVMRSGYRAARFFFAARYETPVARREITRRAIGILNARVQCSCRAEHSGLSTDQVLRG